MGYLDLCLFSPRVTWLLALEFSLNMASFITTRRLFPLTFSDTVVSSTLRKLLGIKDLGLTVHLLIFIHFSLALSIFLLLPFFIVLLYMLPQILRRLGSGLKRSFSIFDWSIKLNGPLEYLFSFCSPSLALLPINRR